MLELDAKVAVVDVQLVDGEIVGMPPQSPAHAGSIRLVEEAQELLP